VLTLDDIKAMRYLNGVVMESLRLFPPVPSDVKDAAHDSALPDGRVVPAGTRVYFEIFQMGRETDLWGPDAAEFKPERWAEGSAAMRKTQFEFPVFQAGPRICLGQAMAMFEAQLLIGFLLDRFRFTMPDPARAATYELGITIAVKGGLNLVVDHVAHRGSGAVN